MYFLGVPRTSHRSMLRVLGWSGTCNERVSYETHSRDLANATRQYAS